MRDKYFGTHEFQGRTEVNKASSDRTFGLVFAAFAVLGGVLDFWRGGERWPIWLGVALLMLIVALAIPRALAPLNWVWTKFGLLLHAVVSPVILTVLFYGCIAPMGLLMRLSGQDPLRLRQQRNDESYWIKREPPGPPAESFRNQF